MQTCQADCGKCTPTTGLQEASKLWFYAEPAAASYTSSHGVGYRGAAAAWRGTQAADQQSAGRPDEPVFSRMESLQNSWADSSGAGANSDRAQRHLHGQAHGLRATAAFI